MGTFDILSDVNTENFNILAWEDKKVLKQVRTAKNTFKLT